MGTTLAALRNLQEVETQLADLRNRILAKWSRAHRIEKRLGQLGAAAEAEHRDVMSRQMEVDRLDLDIRSREIEIAKLRAALNTAKTNKEYAALLSQLNTAKVDSGKIEERAIELIGQLDEIKGRAAQSQEGRAADEAKLAEAKLEAEAFEAENQSKVKELQRRRDAAATEVPAGALQLFERVSATNDGHALAMVLRTNPKREEYACESCNMSITLQQVNALMSRDEPVTCNTCGHILYLETQLTPTR